MNPIVHDLSPYPPIAITEQNQEYANLISQDFASAQSEMTTCTVYAYQRWILEDRYPDLAYTICRIEKVEHRHYNILGRMLYLLGRDPKCQCHQNAQLVVWTGGMPTYTQDVREILENNAVMEGYAAKTYREQAETIRDPKICGMLRRLALDEEIHVRIFREYQAMLR